MSLAEKIHALDVDTSDIVKAALEALDVISVLATVSNGHNAKDMVMVIRRICEAVTQMADQKITPEEVKAELDKFLSGIHDSDADIDTAVHAKFDTAD